VFEKGKKLQKTLRKKNEAKTETVKSVKIGKSNATEMKFSISEVTLTAKYEMLLKFSEFYCLV